MFAEALKYLFESTSYGVFIAIIIVVAVGAWRLSKYHQNNESVKDKVDKLPCDKHKEDISVIRQNGEKLDDITSSIRKIEEWIIRKDVKAMNDLVRKCSPYTLTDVGTIMLSKSKAKDVVDNNLDYLVNLIEATNPKTAYDVEKNSLSVLTNILNDDIFNEIKDFVYNSPESIPIETPGKVLNIEIDMNRILMIMSIYLRDRYFEKHNEIDTKDFIMP